MIRWLTLQRWKTIVIDRYARCIAWQRPGKALPSTRMADMFSSGDHSKNIRTRERWGLWPDPGPSASCPVLVDPHVRLLIETASHCFCCCLHYIIHRASWVTHNGFVVVVVVMTLLLLLLFYLFSYTLAIIDFDFVSFCLFFWGMSKIHNSYTIVRTNSSVLFLGLLNISHILCFI